MSTSDRLNQEKEDGVRFRSVTLASGPAVVSDAGSGRWLVVERGRSVDESLRDGVLAGLADGWHPDADSLEIVRVSDVIRTEPLVRTPEKLWGIGLNYVEHAGDLDSAAPEDEPASFLKARHTLVGRDDVIIVPEGSVGTTAEAEIGLVIGRTAFHVERADALSYVAGLCLILDQTEEDVLRRNPRFLTRSKNYPSFLSVGPDLITMDEALDPVGGDIGALSVETRLNGETVRSNVVARMTFPPDYLVSFHSDVMPLYPGDVISTGTPGAVKISAGDVVSAYSPQLGELSNPVLAFDDAYSLAQLGALGV
jgi:2-keto-4-pentenoate hydratase/2-oxohepta-3-ene-1,7-dioic acid hydratase in catechol pathway